MASGSQFDETAFLTTGGVRLSGTQEREANDMPTEYFLLVVQNGAVARGRGQETSPSQWAGEVATLQGQLSAGPAVATGLAVIGAEDPRGILTFSWSRTVELRPEW